MSNDLFERILVQLQPELAQEFAHAILEDTKKLKALDIIKLGIAEYCKEEIDWTNRNYYEVQLLLTDEEYDLLEEVLS